MTGAVRLRGSGGSVLDPPFNFPHEHRDGDNSVDHEGGNEHPFVLWMVLVKNGGGYRSAVEEDHESYGDNIIAGGKFHPLARVMTNGE